MNTDVLVRATQGFASVLHSIGPDQAGLPTPCQGWSIADLVEHVVSENRSFAAALPAGASSNTPSSPDAPPGEALVFSASDSSAWQRCYRQSAEFMAQRFGGVDDAEVAVQVAGVAGERPVREIYQLQVADTLIHTWDLATAAGVDFIADPTVVDLALRVMRHVPEQARGSGKPFGPAIGAAAGSTGLDELLRLSGRDPQQATGQL
jgi:uncharacterized protein (TIGR03086 family)